MSCSFQFIPHASANSTQRQRELRRSDIRKHAAIVAYKQRVTSTAASVPVPVQQARGLSQQKTLTWLLVGSGGKTKPIVSASKKRRKPFEEDPALDEDGESPGAIPPVEWQTYSGFHLLSALDGSFDEAAMYIDPLPLRVNPSYRSSLISSVSPGHLTGAYRALRYFLQVLIPNNAPVYRIFQVSNVNCMVFLEVAEMSQRPYVAHSVLALLHLVIGNVAPQTTSAHSALQHAVAAMGMMRTALAADDLLNDEAAFIAIVSLAAFARAVGDRAAYRVHRDRLARMIEERGGLASTGHAGFAKALTLQFAPPDSMPLSLRFKQPVSASSEPLDHSDPFFHRRLVTALPIRSIHMPDDDLAKSLRRLPRGFKCLQHEGVLSINSLQLLCRINDACQRHQSDNDLELFQLPPSGGWQPAQYNDFLDCCPSLACAGPNFEKYLSLALLLYTANEFAPQRLFHKGLALYSGPRHVLVAELGSLRRIDLSQTQSECWMWMWWVLIDSWTDDGKLTDVAKLLVSQFWSTFQDISDSGELQLVLGRFFWGGKFEAVVVRLLGQEEGVT